MSADRYVVLGLARVRSPWFGDVSRWASSGAIAADFVKTVSVEEVKARLASGRAFSALLVDGGLTGIDRDLLDTATDLGCAAIVVSDGTGGRDWSAIGATAVLPSDFGRTELEATLVEYAAPIGGHDDVPGLVDVSERTGGFRARTVAVTGAGGTGASTLAVALAQGLAVDPTSADDVVLADLRLHADMATLHDARDVIPGLLELVEAHRAGTPSTESIRDLTFDVLRGRYRLLLGLRRHRDWTAIRPRALHAAIDGLRRSFRVVVADIGADLEGEDTTGSADVEDRNLLSRSTTDIADVVVVVGVPGVKGTHSMLRVIRDLLAAGVDGERILPVVNRAPRRGHARSEVATTLTELLAASHPDHEILSPVFVTERRGVDDHFRDGVALPAAMVDPITNAVRARLDALDERAPARLGTDEPTRIEPGSLGSWADEAAG